MAEELTEDQRGVADLISMLSEEHYCAGWCSGIEFELWDYLVGARAHTDDLGFRPPNGGLLKLLKVGSDLIGGWIAHDGDRDEVFVPMEEWEALYSSRRLKNPVARADWTDEEWEATVADLKQSPQSGEKLSPEDVYFAQHWSDSQVGRLPETALTYPIDLIKNGDYESVLSLEAALELALSLGHAVRRAEMEDARRLGVRSATWSDEKWAAWIDLAQRAKSGPAPLKQGPFAELTDENTAVITESVNEASFIRDLKDDWDDEGAKGTSLFTWESVERLLMACALELERGYPGRLLPKPSIGPVGDGRVDFYWQSESGLVSASIPSSAAAPIHVFSKSPQLGVVRHEMNSSLSEVSVLVVCLVKAILEDPV